VKNTAPRGELLLKKFAGIRFGAEKAAGTPSQLISRRPVGNVPPTPLLGPKKFLNASTAVWISAGVAPDASNTTGSAEAATGLKMRVKPNVATASGMRRKAPPQSDPPIDFLKCRVVIVFVFISFVEVGLLNFAFNCNPVLRGTGNILTRRFEQRPHFG